MVPWSGLRGGSGVRPDGDQPASTTDASTPQTRRREPETDVFIDVAKTAGIDFVHFNGMSGEFYICEVKCAGCGLFDYDRDGHLDLYVCGYVNFNYATHKDCYAPSGRLLWSGPLSYDAIPDRLYRNRGDGTFEDVTATAQILPDKFGNALGIVCADFNGDGWIDLYVANDAHPNHLWVNRGDGTFVNDALLTESAGKVFELSEVSRGAAFGDIDNDGDTDVLIANNSGPPRLLINQVGNRNHWIGLRLVDPAKRRDMIGTWVGVFLSEGPTLWRRVRTAASYASTNDPRLLVGLGDSAKVTKVTALWPDGSVEQWTELPIDIYTTLAKGSGTIVTQARDH